MIHAKNNSVFWFISKRVNVPKWVIYWERFSKNILRKSHQSIRRFMLKNVCLRIELNFISLKYNENFLGVFRIRIRNSLLIYKLLTCSFAASRTQLRRIRLGFRSEWWSCSMIFSLGMNSLVFMIRSWGINSGCFAACATSYHNFKGYFKTKVQLQIPRGIRLTEVQ